MYVVDLKSEWKPHLRQEQFISVPDTVFERFYGGAAGGGKTDVGVCLPLVKKCKFTDRMWYQHPKFKGLIIRRTKEEVRKELLERCNDYYPQTGAVLKQQQLVWEWPWGAKMYLSAAEHEKDVRKFDTEQFTYIFFEELTAFTEFMYMFLSFSRCRPADEDLPACVASASNPGNIGHGWVRKRFVEPCKTGGEILRQNFYDKLGNKILDEQTGKPKYTDRIYIRALGSDNPYLLKNDPQYLTRLHALPEAEKAAKLYGDWWTFSGQVFDNLRIKQYPDEPENALHVIPEFAIPKWWPRVMAIDWGYKAATVCYWAAVSPKGRTYIYREYYVRETDVAVWGTEIGDLSRGENIRRLVLDTNAWDSRGEEKNIADQFYESFKTAYNYNEEHHKHLSLEKASKARISGKTLVQEFLRWKQLPQLSTDESRVYDQDTADSLRRVSDIAYNRYINLFIPQEPELDIPRLQIFDTNVKLIECLPLCVYDEKKTEDVKEWQATDDTVGDDPYDCLRYLLKRVDRYIKESKDEFDKLEVEQKIVQELSVTGDVTSFYRKMEKVEVKTKQKRGSVRRAGRFSRMVH